MHHLQPCHHDHLRLCSELFGQWQRWLRKLVSTEWVIFSTYENPLLRILILYPLVSRASLVAQRLKGLPVCGRPMFDPWFRKIPWKRKWQPTPVFLPGESHGGRSLVGYSSWDRKESNNWATSLSHLVSIYVGHKYIASFFCPFREVHPHIILAIFLSPVF